jgi:Uncharacterized conserved protein (DUF2277)
MCRNIKTLFNFEPPATDEEINASSLARLLQSRREIVPALCFRALALNYRGDEIPGGEGWRPVGQKKVRCKSRSTPP